MQLKPREICLMLRSCVSVFNSISDQSPDSNLTHLHPSQQGLTARVSCPASMKGNHLQLETQGSHLCRYGLIRYLTSLWLFKDQNIRSTCFIGPQKSVNSLSLTHTLPMRLFFCPMILIFIYLQLQFSTKVMLNHLCAPSNIVYLSKC